MVTARWATLDWPDGRFFVVELPVGCAPGEYGVKGYQLPRAALDKLDEFGTVTVGKRADLILVDDNPLADVRNARKHAGVTLRGAWLSKTALQEMLDELAATYTPGLLDRLWPLNPVALGIFLLLWELFG